MTTYQRTRSDDPVLVAFAAQVGETGPVAVEGGRTRWERGGLPADGTRLVRAPEGIVAYAPEEMTVRVRAGTTVAVLDAELAARGQRTALPERGGTVGGALAVGEDDLLAAGVGRVRAAVLEVRYVSDGGRLVTGGGPTVKNVSGFDLPRLLVGSLGTLGLLAEATLRTNPVPAETCWLRSDDADPFAAHAALHRPAAVLTDGMGTWVCLEGHPADIAAQRQVLRTTGVFEEAAGPPALPRHRWSRRRSQLRTLDVAQTGGHVASITTGTVHAVRPAPPVAPDPAARALAVRVKQEFDPGGRLNPGRDPAA